MVHRSHSQPSSSEHSKLESGEELTISQLDKVSSFHSTVVHPPHSQPSSSKHSKLESGKGLTISQLGKVYSSTVQWFTHHTVSQVLVNSAIVTKD